MMDRLCDSAAGREFRMHKIAIGTQKLPHTLEFFTEYRIAERLNVFRNQKVCYLQMRLLVAMSVVTTDRLSEQRMSGCLLYTSPSPRDRG